VQQQFSESIARRRIPSVHQATLWKNPMELFLFKGRTYKKQNMSDSSFDLVLVKRQQEQNVVHLIAHSGRSELVRVLKSGGYDEAVF